jgi:hypothetical protein
MGRTRHRRRLGMAGRRERIPGQCFLSGTLVLMFAKFGPFILTKYLPQYDTTGYVI